MNHCRLQRWTDLCGLLLICIFSLVQLPADLLGNDPASGGDIGSHFWPLWMLVNEALPHGSIRPWNPGNLGGEPLLLHYFPLPFFLMALLARIVSIGMAFNFGVILPAILFAPAAYLCCRGQGLRSPLPLLTAAAVAIFFYNESVSMWGGNSLSLIAGQFAHAYAIIFFLGAAGALTYELRTRRYPVFSPLLFAAVIASHGYLTVGIPILAGAVLLFSPHQTFARRMGHIACSTVVGTLLAGWFLIPMLSNAPWTTPMALTWDRTGLFAQLFPPFFYPLFVIIAGAAFLGLLRRSPAEETGHPETARTAMIWLTVAAGYSILFFLFPRMGLVDIRALPQVQLSICLIAGIAAGSLLRRFSQLVSGAGALIAVVAALGWCAIEIHRYPLWLRWSFSSWHSKSLYSYVEDLSSVLRGDLSMPRVIYEEADINRGAGGERVFEMLPLFAGRGTLEGVYNQSTILAPEVYAMQALITPTPSCPLVNYRCPSLDVKGSYERMRLLGVSDLILSSERSRADARANSLLRSRGTFGPWELFSLSNPSSLAAPIDRLPRLADERTWREDFYRWFLEYPADSQPQIVSSTIADSTLRERILSPEFWSGRECTPRVSLAYNSITLHTDCPGAAHLIRFAYNPLWRATDDSPVFMVSPGFIAVIPAHTETTLNFGPDRSWYAGNLAALLGVIGYLSLLVCSKIRRR